MERRAIVPTTLLAPAFPVSNAFDWALQLSASLQYPDDRYNQPPPNEVRPEERTPWAGSGAGAGAPPKRPA